MSKGYNWQAHEAVYQEQGYKKGLCYRCWSLSLQSGVTVAGCHDCARIQAKLKAKKK